jgi:hypothetical protein
MGFRLDAPPRTALTGAAPGRQQYSRTYVETSPSYFLTRFKRLSYSACDPIQNHVISSPSAMPTAR